MRRPTTRGVPMSRFQLPAEAVLRAREKLVLDHFRDEVLQDWDGTLSTFPHPHYELIAPMVVHDGDGEVRGYYQDTRVAFPDQHHELIALRHSPDAVIVEFWLIGTHLGPYGKIPPTGGRHRTRMTASFIFDADEHLVVERVYFDQITVLKQLLAGLDKRKPGDLLKLGRAVVGLLSAAGTEPDPRLLNTTPPVLDTDPADVTTDGATTE
jgi:predicted ester cyclase